MKIDRVGGDLRPEKIIKKRIEGGRGTGEEIRLHGEAGASVEQKNGRHQWKKDELPGKCVDKRRMQTNTSETRQRRKLLCRKINIFYVGKCAIIQKFCAIFAHQGGAVKIYSGMHIYGETIKTGEGI